MVLRETSPLNFLALIPLVGVKITVERNNYDKDSGFYHTNLIIHILFFYYICAINISIGNLIWT